MDLPSDVHRIVSGRLLSDDSLTEGCYPFPNERDCSDSKNLCYAWKSATFLIILTAVLQLITLVAYSAVLHGNYFRRQQGWKMISLFHVLIGIFL
jgi:hypothetical protein